MAPNQSPRFRWNSDTATTTIGAILAIAVALKTSGLITESHTTDGIGGLIFALLIAAQGYLTNHNTRPRV